MASSVSGHLPRFPAQDKIMDFLRTENLPTQMVFQFATIHRLAEIIAGYIANEKLDSCQSLENLIEGQLELVEDQIIEEARLNNDAFREQKVQALASILIGGFKECARALKQE